jgi:hypothetical protein
VELPLEGQGREGGVLEAGEGEGLVGIAATLYWNFSFSLSVLSPFCSFFPRRREWNSILSDTARS